MSTSSPAPWGHIPYAGSFQHGRTFRSGDPLSTVWRQIERMATIDNLTRVAKMKGHDASKAKVACLRARQAIEFRNAARGASLLTRPLLLYYSALNLVRAVMLTYTGDIGGRTHGLKFIEGATLLQCGAQVTKAGTFPTFAATVGAPPELKNATLSLRDIFAVLPEVVNDFPLLQAGQGSVVWVRVQAMIRGPMTLRFGVERMLTVDEFKTRWTEMLFWFKDVCELADAPYTLRVKDVPSDEKKIGDFCARYLIGDLMRRPDAVWFDHVAANNVVLLKRLPAYLAALFVLSSVSRYHPELFDAAREPTDLGYFLGSMLDAAERFFPQLILELLGNGSIFFE